jgi:hypothetical protein
LRLSPSTKKSSLGIFTGVGAESVPEARPDPSQQGVACSQGWPR